MVSTAALARDLSVDVAMVADVLTAIGRAGYPTDPLADSRLTRALIVENTAGARSWSDAVLAGYRSRGLRSPSDDGLTARVDVGTEATLVTYRGRPVGRVIEHRQRCAYIRLDDADVGASVVLGRLTARAIGGVAVELTTDPDGVEVRPGVPTS